MRRNSENLPRLAERDTGVSGLVRLADLISSGASAAVQSEEMRFDVDTEHMRRGRGHGGCPAALEREIDRRISRADSYRQ